MGLTEQERNALKKLQEKEKQPDAPPVGKSITANVDLSDPKSIAAAVKHGFLTADEADEAAKDGDGDGDDDKEETPNRKGYFTS